MDTRDLQFTKDRIHIAADGIQAEINHSLSNFKDIKIYFGGSKHPRFSLQMYLL